MISTNVHVQNNFFSTVWTQNLAWVKSFNICIELEDNQEIFVELFRLIFSIVKFVFSHPIRLC